MSFLPAVSLFSGSGIGNVGLCVAGITFVVANELLEDRAALLALNLPEAEVIPGDIWEKLDQIIERTGARLQKEKVSELFLLLATPPCQGMSANGLGKLLNNARKGLRPKLDPRNRLIIPALKFAQVHRPRWVVFENVVQMKNTLIEDEDRQLTKIVDLIPRYLGDEYVGRYYEVEFADYGLPQRRQRLITVYTRDNEAIESYRNNVELIPEPTHDSKGRLGRHPWVTVRKALTEFPPLDGKGPESASDLVMPFHRVPVLDPKKYEWISHTSEGCSAFDNQCVNPKCRFQNNPTHGAVRGKDGINRAKQSTPLYCVKCGTLLPRPYVAESNGKLRIMSGYTSAYKRMPWDMPASTLTRNLSYPSSDHTLHPSENRVLSIAEALKLQSISNYEYKWGPVRVRGKQYVVVPDTLITDCIGESVPPIFTELLGRHLLQVATSKAHDLYLQPKQLAFTVMREET
jgi:DNA (cytosine-5)-methyltransferase 1